MRLPKTLILLFLVGCTTTGGSIIPIKYQFTDLPAEQRIELRWRNDTSETLCLLPEAWPDSAGIVYGAHESVFLVIDGQRFPMVESMLWECTSAFGCSVHVAPGEKVTATIPYKNFNLPKELMDHPKTLEFSTFAEACPPQEPHFLKPGTDGDPDGKSPSAGALLMPWFFGGGSEMAAASAGGGTCSHARSRDRSGGGCGLRGRHLD